MNTTPQADRGDFTSLLHRHGLLPKSAPANSDAARIPPIAATTILALKFADGVLIAGDRRATAGHTIMYDRADKVIEIDRRSVMAIAGVPATAWEMARMLEHSFHYFRRTQLAELSHEGKVRTLSRLLRENLGFVLQGVGVVAPIFATIDPDGEIPRVYFYDPMGAQFEAAEYAASGSGSPAVRAILHYENVHGFRPLGRLKATDAILLALRALETAAESDTATAGIDRRARIYPTIKIITTAGIETLPEARLARLCQEHLAIRHRLPRTRSR